MYFSSADRYERLSPTGLGLVLAAHALALWVLAAQRHSVPELIEHPILVSLVAPEQEAKPAPPTIEPPQVIKPVVKPIQKKPEPRLRPQPEVIKEPEPQLVAQVPASSPAPAVEVPPPAPVVEAPPPAPSASTQSAEAAPPTEAPIEQPRFNADYLNNPAPSYPPLSRRLREEGRVLLRVRVDLEGNPAQVKLHESSGFSRLDERAVETVKRWKFVPARQSGQPVEAWVIVPIQFSLKGK